jgi:hypothetical protein
MQMSLMYESYELIVAVPSNVRGHIGAGTQMRPTTDHQAQTQSCTCTLPHMLKVRSDIMYESYATSTAQRHTSYGPARL